MTADGPVEYKANPNCNCVLCKPDWPQRGISRGIDAHHFDFDGAIWFVGAFKAAA